MRLVRCDCLEEEEKKFVIVTTLIKSFYFSSFCCYLSFIFKDKQLMRKKNENFLYRTKTREKRINKLIIKIKKKTHKEF
jgi:hypothetical protein